MDVAVELSGEHPTLARSEALHVASLERPSPRVHDMVRSVVHRDAPPAERFASRLGLAWGAGRVVAVTQPTPEAVSAVADDVPVEGSVLVRAKRLDPSLPADVNARAERMLGARLALRAPVDVETPGTLVRVLLDQRGVVAAPWQVVPRASFEARHVRHRPFFAPVTLHPRLARALVNLADVRPGSRVWDPFCGTGGVLVEAGLVGARVVGSDLQKKMADGAAATLAHAGVAASEIFAGDVADAARVVGPVDAIVTDPPYGKGATLNREARDALYARFFAAASDVLLPGAALVCMLPVPSAEELAGDAWRHDEMHVLPVHRSLTRYVHRFTRA